MCFMMTLIGSMAKCNIIKVKSFPCTHMFCYDMKLPGSDICSKSFWQRVYQLVIIYFAETQIVDHVFGCVYLCVSSSCTYNQIIESLAFGIFNFTKYILPEILPLMFILHILNNNEMCRLQKDWVLGKIH